jgi:hypothetical protein
MISHMIVRATVRDASIRDEFDQWYATDHMAEAFATFHPARCWRSWSKVDPAVHYACYEFASVEALDSMIESDAFKAMVDDFTRKWEGKVTRDRDFMVAVQLVQ